MRLTLASDPFEVRAALQLLRKEMTVLNLSDDAVTRVEIIMAEILNNVVEHACRNRPDCRIDIEMARTRADLRVKVVDDGITMPGGKLPARKTAALSDSPEALPEGGFGWSLIRDLAHDLAYARRNGQNQLTFALVLD